MKLREANDIFFPHRSQSCNKDLWAQINAALQQTGK